MIEITREGHKILIGKEGKRFFLFDSDRVHEGVEYIQQHNLRYVQIGSFSGYKGSDISFLRELSDFIEGISVAETQFDISVLNELHGLVFLGFADNGKAAIDLSNFPSLSTLACDYSKRLLSLESCEQLKSLTLTRFRPTNRTVDEIPRLASLTKLNLFVTNIDSFVGIGKFSVLKELTLFRASRLENISALKDASGTLATLEFDQCKKIRNYETLADLFNLVKLIIGQSAPIHSLSFVKKLTKLEFLSFVGTNLVDGDLSPTIGLGYVGFEDRRHYSHKFEEISRK